MVLLSGLKKGRPRLNVLTFLQAKQILAKYSKRAGTCVDDPELPLFVREVLQQLLWSGANGNLRKFCFLAHRGCFTIPFELETIEKIKIDDWVGSSWDRWFEYHSSGDIPGCTPVGNAAFEEPNYFPTVYDIPAGGARVGCMGTCSEADDAHIVVKGTDLTGREIITTHNGQQVVGEYLQIKKNEIRYTQATFAQISGIVKSRTNGYVNLLWIDLPRNMKGFLADYSPLEEVPAYRRYRITSPCFKEHYKISVLGRIRLKETYTDNDLIPFENILAINMAGQAVQEAKNRNLGVSAASAAIGAASIENENAYKKPDVGQPVEVFIPMSGGAVPSINVGGGFGWWGGPGRWGQR